MKVYQVSMSYYDGDHDHGTWDSPMFVTRELAEQYKLAIMALDENDDRKWWNNDSYTNEQLSWSMYVNEFDVHESFDGVIPEYHAMLHKTWT